MQLLFDSLRFSFSSSPIQGYLVQAEQTGPFQRAIRTYFERDHGMGSTVKVGSPWRARYTDAVRSLFVRTILSIAMHLTLMRRVRVEIYERLIALDGEGVSWSSFTIHYCMNMKLCYRCFQNFGTPPEPPVVFFQKIIYLFL